MDGEHFDDLPPVDFVTEEEYHEASVPPQMSKEDGQTPKRSDKAGTVLSSHLLDV